MKEENLERSLITTNILKISNLWPLVYCQLLQVKTI